MFGGFRLFVLFEMFEMFDKKLAFGSTSGRADNPSCG